VAGTGGSGSTTTTSQGGVGGAGSTSATTSQGGVGGAGSTSTSTSQGGAGGEGEGAAGAGGSAGAGIEQMVGPEGATLETEGVKVTIPEGALAEMVTIGIHRLSDDEIAALPGFDEIVGVTSGALTSNVFAFTPHGTTFQLEVEIQLPAADGQTVLRLDDESDATWDLIPAVVDGGTATFTTYGFSVGAVADLDGTPGCDPDACSGFESHECIYMELDFQGDEVGWRCAEPCTQDDDCSFSVACFDETTKSFPGWWCGIVPGRDSGGCDGIIGIDECYGSDGQNPNLTLCVDNECTDTPAG